MGDVFQKITHRQSEILMRLINFISDDIVSITKSIEYCAELDAYVYFLIKFVCVNFFNSLSFGVIFADFSSHF